MTHSARLTSRGVIEIGGADARELLQSLLTQDLDQLAEGAAQYSALLTPQGKYLFDFIVINQKDTILLECDYARLGDLIKRLTMYKLRADMTLQDVSDSHPVTAHWDGPAPEGAIPDPRDPRLGAKTYWNCETNTDEAAWHTHRIALTVPQGPPDVEVDKTFWLECEAERLNGVAFQKGCFIGQEQTSRMKRRGTVKKGFVTLEGDAKEGAQLLANNKEIGRIGSTAPGLALGFVRLEKLAAALAEGATFTTEDGAKVTVKEPKNG
ncbi:MAG: YgfZ/GcvT domain-containing protein [Alphaproteobacteria bacterium]